MDTEEKLLHSIGVDNRIRLEDIPGIDLYMDQVIQLFEQAFESSKRVPEEKILTKTMINNYAKGKLFPAVKNKKYTRDHIMAIALIYQLKGALSISDIKAILDAVEAEEGHAGLEPFYEGYLALQEKNSRALAAEMKDKAAEAERGGEVIRQKATKPRDQDGDSGDILETALLAASMASLSSLYRRMAEQLVDRVKEKSGQGA